MTPLMYTNKEINNKATTSVGWKIPNKVIVTTLYTKTPSRDETLA
jgi:hypothetical protein